jgi:tRNA (cmo5U34)-methyltransferase
MLILTNAGHAKAGAAKPKAMHMKQNMAPKSTVAEIRERFDQDVARFSNLETGQQTTLDAPLCLELITRAAALTNPAAASLLDIGCGAGTYSIKMLGLLPDLDCTLLDLSRPMLDKASERVGAATRGRVATFQGDIREVALPDAHFDIILAGAVFHHLRTTQEWEAVFSMLYRVLKPGGSVWISDLVEQDTPALNALFNEKYSDYLVALGGVAYKDQVLAYIGREDSPRSLTFQMDLLKQVGFQQVEVLHKNLCFAAFGGIK